jgi:hypothetical protein
MAATTADIPRVPLPFDSNSEGSVDERRRAINDSAALDQNRDAAPLDDSGKETDAVKEKKKKKGGGRRIIICLLALVLMVTLGVYALWRVFAAAGQDADTHKVMTDPNNKPQGFSTADDKYNAAINSLAVNNNPGTTGAVDASTNPAKDGVINDPLKNGAGLDPNLQSVTISDASKSGQVQVKEAGEVRARQTVEDASTSSSAGTLAAGPRLAVTEASTSARSMPFTAMSRLKAPPATQGGDGQQQAMSRPQGPGGSVSNGVAVPPFGTMLPTRTLGMIYTLRSSGGLVRFELTREVSGQGWSMRKGTVIVGALRGADVDRAFISVVGFIDPESGGFVKIQGDMLGGDGASGLRGQRKKVSSGFSRVLKKMGDAGLGALSALAGGLGRGTVVITDAYSRGVAPLTSELGGVIGSDRNEFIEVKAGTPCYVMITQLPEEVHGVDALSKMTSDSLSVLSDSSQVRGATGLSEMQMAELISSGNVNEIRSALPRMTPEMRRVAEAVISQGGGR